MEEPAGIDPGEDHSAFAAVGEARRTEADHHNHRLVGRSCCTVSFLIFRLIMLLNPRANKRHAVLAQSTSVSHRDFTIHGRTFAEGIGDPGCSNLERTFCFSKLADLQDCWRDFKRVC